MTGDGVNDYSNLSTAFMSDMALQNGICNNKHLNLVHTLEKVIGMEFFVVCTCL